MKRPEHPLIVALVETYARQAGTDPDEMWAWLDGRRAPPPEVRDAIVAAFFPRVPPESFLTPRADNDTFDTMDATEIAPARRGRPLAQPRHPFVIMLKKRRLTVAEVALEVKRPASTVKSWYKSPKDEGARPIPRAAAERIKELYGVPLSAWHRIAD